MNIWWGDPVSKDWFTWRLYDIETDPSEAHDISEQHPALMQELIDAWDKYAETHGVVRQVRIREFERWQH